MIPKIRDIIACLHAKAPFSLAEPWDNVGLILGNPDREVTSLLIGIDPTCALVDEAIAIKADTIITHHPLIFQPLSTIDTATPQGRIIEKTLQNSISIIACHTNLDTAENGVSDALGRALGLVDLKPLATTSTSANSGQGMGRIGIFPGGISKSVFLAYLHRALGLNSAFIAGTLPDTVATVALCGGSGSDLAVTAHQKGADIYLTGEIKHHIARWAEENDFCLIEGTHYATERPAISLLADILLADSFTENWNILVTQTQTERHPFALTPLCE